MKRKFFTFITLLTVVFSMSSCLGDDESTTVEYTNDAGITAFSLGTMDRYVTNAAGKDTLLKSKVTGSNYSFTIDQYKCQIYNADSLPVGTRISAVLATISAKNSSYIQIKYKNSEGNDSLVWYSSSDSINFTNVKDSAVRAYSMDAKSYKEYQVKINVHTEKADTFIWRPLAVRNASLAALDSLKAVYANGQVAVFGKKDGATLVYTSTDGTSWNSVAPSMNLGAQAFKNVIVKDDELYVLNTETHQILKSADAQTWTAVGTDASLQRLLGAGSKYIYAYAGSADNAFTGIMKSADNGATWTADNIDKSSDVAYLPNLNVSMAYTAIKSTKDAENILLMGTRSEVADTIAQLWMRTIDFTGNADAGNAWHYVTYDKNQSYKLPKLAQLYMTRDNQNEYHVALGSNKKMYKSVDGGVKWYVDTLVMMPNEGPVLDTDKPFTFVKVKEASVAPDGTAYDSFYYMVINNGNVWRGRYNKDGWLKQD